MKLNEKITPIDRHTVVIDEPYQVIKYLQDKKLAQRIVYDKNQDWYMISSNDQLTHGFIVEQVYDNGFYGDIDILDYVDNGWKRIRGSNTQKPIYLYNLLYTPQEELFSNFFDGIDHAYSYAGFGAIYTKGFDLVDLSIGSVLATPSNIITESKGDNMNIPQLLEKLKKILIEPHTKSFYDEMEDESGINTLEDDLNEEAVANGGGFSTQLGQSPTPSVKVNGQNWTSGKNYKKKKSKNESFNIKKLNEKIIKVLDDQLNIIKFSEDVMDDVVLISNWLDKLGFKEVQGEGILKFVFNGNYTHEIIVDNNITYNVYKDNKIIDTSNYEADNTIQIQKAFNQIAEKLDGRE